MGQINKPIQFKRILIANRGEIVKRIAHTASLMGIETVGIFSQQETQGERLPFHIRYCDHHASLGEGSLQETYLNIEKIIKIAKEYNVDAIHPGYGFLSENPIFCRELKKAGLVFIGPDENSINVMGSKKISKQYVKEKGLPVIPGYQGDDQSFERFEKEALEIGYPVLIKASAGGGGKGMRKVLDPKDLKDAFERAKSEGLNSLGDETLLIEKYI